MKIDASIEDPQEMQVEVTGPNGANRLFIYAGYLLNNLYASGQDWTRAAIEVELGSVKVLSQCDILNIIATAYPNAIGSGKDYAVDHVFATYNPNEGRIILHVDFAIQPTGAQMWKIGYQVMVLARCQ